MPRSGFFGGLGGSANSVTFPNQEVYGLGLSDIYQAGSLVARGYAAGDTTPYLGSSSTIAPVLQLGYYQTIGDSNWLWGGKLTYNYVGASGNRENFLIPQAGAYGGTVSGQLEGNVYAHSYQMNLRHQFALVPVAGYAFDRGFVYGGAGPTLSQIASNLNGLIGFADINGSRFDLTGPPASFSATNWVWGATVVVGGTYFFAPSWFIDVNYSYTVSNTETNAFAAPFSTVHGALTFTGLALGTYSGTADNQALMVSINKVF